MSMRLAKTALLMGLSVWMSVAVLNNITDPATNRFHVGAMLEMSLLRSDPNQLGNELLWRAIPAQVSIPLLWGIVIVQLAICLYLWKATINFARSAICRNEIAVEKARTTAIRALTCFMCLWLGFMAGGFWFGYWIKQGPIQQVHMTLLVLSILALSFIGHRGNEATGNAEWDRFSDRTIDPIPTSYET